MTEVLKEIKFDNLEYDEIQKLCEEFSHYHFVQNELADIIMIFHIIAQLMEDM